MSAQKDIENTNIYRMKREVKIGIYAVAILLASWAGIRFLSGMDIFGRSKTYHAYYEQVNGLQKAAPVVIRGVVVGQVTDIAIAENKPGFVDVSFSVERKYDIPSDSEASMHSAGLMGGKAIELRLGTSAELLSSGATIASSVVPDMMESVGGMLGDLKTKLESLLDNLNNTVSSVEGLLDDNSKSITAAIKSLKSVLAELERSKIVENLDSFTGTLKQNGPHIDSIVADVNKLTGELAEKNVGAELSAAVAELNTLLSQINKGEGSVGKLVNDKVLYEKLAEASNNLSTLLADIKENPKRYINIRVFGSSPEEKEAAKAVKKQAKAAKKQAKAQKNE